MNSQSNMAVATNPRTIERAVTLTLTSTDKDTKDVFTSPRKEDAARDAMAKRFVAEHLHPAMDRLHEMLESSGREKYIGDAFNDLVSDHLPVKSRISRSAANLMGRNIWGKSINPRRISAFGDMILYGFKVLGAVLRHDDGAHWTMAMAVGLAIESWKEPASSAGCRPVAGGSRLGYYHRPEVVKELGACLEPDGLVDPLSVDRCTTYPEEQFIRSLRNGSIVPICEDEEPYIKNMLAQTEDWDIESIREVQLDDRAERRAFYESVRAFVNDPATWAALAVPSPDVAAIAASMATQEGGAK